MTAARALIIVSLVATSGCAQRVDPNAFQEELTDLDLDVCETDADCIRMSVIDCGGQDYHWSINRRSKAEARFLADFLDCEPNLSLIFPCCSYPGDGRCSTERNRCALSSPGSPSPDPPPSSPPSPIPPDDDIVTDEVQNW